MNFIRAFARWAVAGLVRYAGVQQPGPKGYDGGPASEVTFDSAMQLSAVWACVKLLAETVASLPLTIYRKSPNGRQVASDHPLSILFSGKVNRYQNRIEFFESVILNLVMHGNAYCLIERTGGRITGLVPLMSAQIETTMLNDGAVVHTYTTSGGVTVLSSDSVWHLKLMGNGIVGLSVLQYQRDTLGIAQGAERAVSNVYANGGKRSGVLMIDRLLTPEQRLQIRQNFNGLTEGDSSRLLVLEAGAKFDPVSMSPADIELLKSRQFQIAEICRWYGVPSVMVNDTSGSTVWGSGISEIVRGFYKITLRPILEKVETSMLVTLFAPADRARYEVEFDFEGLLRSDYKSRMDGYASGINNGVITPNEARLAEGLPKMAGGDGLFVQGAMVPIEMAGKTPASPATQPPQGEDANGA